MRRTTGVVFFLIAIAGTAVGVVASTAHVSPESRRTLVERGAASLISSQSSDGSFGVVTSPGDVAATALCARSLALASLSLNPALAEARDDAVERATRWLLARQARDGSFSRATAPGDAVSRTSLAVLALAAIDWTANARAIVRARRWLEDSQRPAGSAGEGAWPDARGDAGVVPTELALAALGETGTTAGDRSLVRAAAYLGRAQRSDGRFEGEPGADAATTWAGVLGLLRAGASLSDTRVERGLRWLERARRSGTSAVFASPGFARDLARVRDGLGSRVGDDRIAPWSRDAAACLAATVRPDGSWESDAGAGRERHRELATSAALDALGALPDDELR